MSLRSLLAFALVTAAACGLKDPDPAQIYAGPAQPEPDPPLPAVGPLTPSSPIALASGLAQHLQQAAQETRRTVGVNTPR